MVITLLLLLAVGMAHVVGNGSINGHSVHVGNGNGHNNVPNQNILGNIERNVNGNNVQHIALNNSNNNGGGGGAAAQNIYDITTLPDYVQKGMKVDHRAKDWETLYWAEYYGFDDNFGAPKGGIWDHYERWRFWYKCSSSGVANAAKPRLATRMFCHYCKSCVGSLSAQETHLTRCSEAPDAVNKLYKDKKAADRAAAKKPSRKRKLADLNQQQTPPQSLFDAQSTTTTNVGIAPWLITSPPSQSPYQQTAPYQPIYQQQKPYQPPAKRPRHGFNDYGKFVEDGQYSYRSSIYSPHQHQPYKPPYLNNENLIIHNQNMNDNQSISTPSVKRRLHFGPQPNSTRPNSTPNAPQSNAPRLPPQPTGQDEIKWMEAANMKLTEWLIANALPFGIVNQPEFRIFIDHITHDRYRPPNKEKVRTTLMNNKYNDVQFRVHEVIRNPNFGPWWMGYDGGADRAGKKVHNLTLCNPAPLLFKCGKELGDGGSYPARKHVEEISGYMDEAIDISPAIILNGLMTDNENTMKKTRRDLAAQRGIDYAGCPGHGLNLLSGDTVTWNAPRKLQMDKLQASIRNTRFREKLEFDINKGDTDKRWGISPAGDTRWSSYVDVIRKQLEYKDYVNNILTRGECDESGKPWAEFLPVDVREIALSTPYWQWIFALSVFMECIIISIRRVDGNYGAGVVYYAYILVKKFVIKKLAQLKAQSKYHRGLLHVTDEIIINGFAGNVMTECNQNMYKLMIKMKILIIERWTLIHSNVYYLSYFLDIRFVEETEFIGDDYGINYFNNIIITKYTDRALSNKLLTLFTAFRSKRDYFEPHWKRVIDDITPNSDYTESIKFWRNIQIEKPKNDDPINILSAIAIKSLSAPSSNGHNERTMKAIKRQHTAKRNGLKGDNLRKLIYIENNLKLLKHFENKQ